MEEYTPIIGQDMEGIWFCCPKCGKKLYPFICVNATCYPSEIPCFAQDAQQK